jgi:hypothetical protein
MNYIDTFIEVADDCPARTASEPEAKRGTKTIPVLQYEMIANHPYRYTQEDVLFETYADHKGIPKANRPVERTKFFAKDQACLRASALGKRYGWGLHHDENGKVASYAIESSEYKRLASDKTIKHVKAMRSKRA